MSQPQQMNMGGPVGGAMAMQQLQQQQQQQPQHQMNAGTPSNTASPADPKEISTRLNTYIYEYFIYNQHYDVARAMLGTESLNVQTVPRQSPSQRQANGIDDANSDRPKDLPDPQFNNPGESPFLSDWWAQFWDIFSARRSNGKQSSLSYVGTQRIAQKGRNAMMGMDPAMQQNMRNSMAMMNNGMVPNDLKKAAMQNAGQMNPQQAQRMQQMRAQQQQQGMMPGQAMERSNSQMEMNGPRSGSPNSGDAPSPKRQRLEGNMQQQGGRPGPQGQMINNQVGPDHPPLDPTAAQQTHELLVKHSCDPDNMPSEIFHRLAIQPTNNQRMSVETYSQKIHKVMKKAIAVQANSNMNKGMPPNAAAMAQVGAQGSPLSQGGIEGSMGGDFGPPGALRPGMVQNPAVPGGQAGAGNGNHALQDYQMQLMLLEQQNKKRLLMARQEQDSMTHSGMPNGGQFAPNMSPQGSRAGPSPNPNDMARGTPKMQPGTSPNGQMQQGRASPAPGFDQNQIPPQMRNQMMVSGPNGQVVPRSHPGQMPNQLTQQQMEMFNNQQRMNLTNGTFPGPQQMPPNMMPGVPGQMPPGQQPPNMTPRQGNMPPPPAPPQNGQGNTQPSSPAPSAAPPTPNQANKAKPGGKKDNKKGKKGANQTGATPASEAEQPPTPTPATPITPMNANSFHKGPQGGVPNGAAPQPQPNQQQPVVPQMNQDIGVGQPFGNLDQGYPSDMNLDFADLGGGGDVLDNFDFDSFLNNDDTNGLGFDNTFFETGLEAGGDGMQ